MCPLCQQCEWGDAQWDHSRVVLSEALVHTSFERRSCMHCYADGQQCEGSLFVDGREYGVLRKTAHLAFSHTLLYGWAARFEVASPEPWTATWKLTVQRIRGLDLQQRRQLYEDARVHFMQATMDFVQLQNLDYVQGFSCGCHKREPLCQMDMPVGSQRQGVTGLAWVTMYACWPCVLWGRR